MCFHAACMFFYAEYFVGARECHFVRDKRLEGFKKERKRNIQAVNM